MTATNLPNNNVNAVTTFALYLSAAYSMEGLMVGTPAHRATFG